MIIMLYPVFMDEIQVMKVLIMTQIQQKNQLIQRIRKARLRKAMVIYHHRPSVIFFLTPKDHYRVIQKKKNPTGNHTLNQNYNDFTLDNRVLSVIEFIMLYSHRIIQ